MSAMTRINRKTYSTPRKNPAGRLIHQSTNYGSVRMPDGTVRWMQLSKGITRVGSFER